MTEPRSKPVQSATPDPKPPRRRRGAPVGARGADPAQGVSGTGPARRGRKPVSEAEARSRVLSIRLQPDEAARLTAIATKAGMSESEYVRRSLRSSRVVVAKTPETDVALVRELIAQGNNLNQITRAVNRTRGIPAGTVEAIEKIHALLDRMLALGHGGRPGGRPPEGGT